jgi:hypothetical protein
VLAPEAYDGRVSPREVVPLRGEVEPGESGGPVVDTHGDVLAMVFAGSKTGPNGFAVPVELVTRGVAADLHPVSSGPCLG